VRVDSRPGGPARGRFPRRRERPPLADLLPVLVLGHAAAAALAIPPDLLGPLLGSAEDGLVVKERAARLLRSRARDPIAAVVARRLEDERRVVPYEAGLPVRIPGRLVDVLWRVEGDDPLPGEVVVREIVRGEELRSQRQERVLHR